MVGGDGISISCGNTFVLAGNSANSVLALHGRTLGVLRMKVFDADTHALEPMEMWREYVEPRYRDAVPRLIVDENNIERMVIGDKVMAPGPFPIGGVGVPGGLTDPDSVKSTTWDKAYPGGWDAAVRIKDMDAEGIHQTVIYTSVGLFFGGDEDPQLIGALCRAYNNWIADWCKQAPERFSAMAIVPLMDVEAAVVEARRAIEQLGLKGVMLRPNPYAGRMLHDPAYAPFWSELQGLGVPVAFHEGNTGNIPFVGAERCKKNPGFDNPGYLAFALAHIVCHPHEQEIAAMQMIAGGVLEKFPRLKVAFMESGCGWLPYWLHRMDEHLEALPYFLPHLKMSPTDYFKRQCWVATEGEEADLAGVLRYLGDDRVVWASDYPHFDCKLPGALDWCKRSGLSEPVLEKLLWKNAVALYGF
ncbi:MAG TPA: amidohydrolase family protein [Kofleriaceae bacterium]|nr:amidohydrolase family protein [Kofleriaceae bacterium]